MTYSELSEKLTSIEKSMGIYLFDPCVDAENVGPNPSDFDLYDSALCAATDRANELGLDIYKLLENA